MKSGQKSLFIAGTDTGAGKTSVSAALMKEYAGPYPHLRYWKPVQTGFPGDDDAATVERLSGFARTVSGLRFREPLSPHRAAELEHREIGLPQLLDRLTELQNNFNLIIEGAGGICTPLNRKLLWVDFLSAAHLDVVLVARTELGTINHTLLSVEALLRRSLRIVALAFCGPDNPDNITTLATFTGLPVLGRINPGVDSPPILDREKILAPYMSTAGA